MRKLLACVLLALPACVIRVGSHGDWDFEGPNSRDVEIRAILHREFNGHVVDTGLVVEK